MNLSFTFIDFLVVAVVLISTVYAAYRGFLNETLTILSWAVAAFLTLYFGPFLVPMAKTMISQQWLAPLAAYAGVFVVTFLPLSFMSHRFSQAVKSSPLGPLDRGLGIAFGVVRGLVIVGIAYLAFTYFMPVPKQPEWLTSSRTLPIMQESASMLASIVPSQAPRDYVTPAPKKQAEKQADKQGDNETDKQADKQPDKQIDKSGEKQAEKQAEKQSGQDNLGELIRQEDNGAAQPASVKKSANSSGESDRRALDKLFETSSGSK
jgi:membrane protein required for colicin V production